MEADGALPGISGSAPADRIILHVDNDCFYASCERLREPSLEGKPVVVGMGFEPGDDSGAVATASYEAREYGVESAQAISEAMERLPPHSQVPAPGEGPTAHYRPVKMDFYQECAHDVRAILDEYADTLRIVSIDEAYLDCTEQTSWDEARAYAQSLRDRVLSEVGLPVSIGVAPSMSVAKIASDHDKPEGLVVVNPASVTDFLDPLPLGDLHGVGPVTASVLAENGLETIGDVARTDRDVLAEDFGDRGRELHNRANGIDRRPVTPRGDPKSLSRESAFGEPTADMSVIQDQVQHLGQAVAQRATDRGATYRTIGIKVVTPPFEIHTRERSLPGPVDDPALIVEVAQSLLGEFTDERIRKVGVRVSNLSFTAGDQTALDKWDTGTGNTEWEGHRGSQARLSRFSRDESD